MQDCGLWQRLLDAQALHRRHPDAAVPLARGWWVPCSTMHAVPCTPVQYHFLRAGPPQGSQGNGGAWGFWGARRTLSSLPSRTPPCPPCAPPAAARLVSALAGKAIWYLGCTKPPAGACVQPSESWPRATRSPCDVPRGPSSRAHYFPAPTRTAYFSAPLALPPLCSPSGCRGLGVQELGGLTAQPCSTSKAGADQASRPALRAEAPPPFRTSLPCPAAACPCCPALPLAPHCPALLLPSLLPPHPTPPPPLPPALPCYACCRSSWGRGMMRLPTSGPWPAWSLSWSQATFCSSPRAGATTRATRTTWRRCGGRGVRGRVGAGAGGCGGGGACL